MNEQQRQAVERLRLLADGYERNWRTDDMVDQLRGVVVTKETLTTLLALIDRPTTCFECSTELQGPFCPKCSAPIGAVEASELATDLRALFNDTENHGGDHQDPDCEICNSPLRVAEFLDRLSAPVRS